MDEFFSVWIQRHTHPNGFLDGTATIWIQRGPLPLVSGWSEHLDKPVRSIAGPVEWGSKTFNLWLGYALRTAKAWNLLASCRERHHFIEDTPWYIIHDRLLDDEDDQAAAFLRECFAASPWQITGRNGWKGNVPVLPPETEWVGPG